MELLFENSRGEERVIADVNSWSEAYEVISDFLSQHNFKSYYTRTWFHEDTMYIDVGSHSELFLLKGYNQFDWLEEQDNLKEDDVEESL